jgi:hypothetical protein
MADMVISDAKEFKHFYGYAPSNYIYLLRLLELLSFIYLIGLFYRYSKYTPYKVYYNEHGAYIKHKGATEPTDLCTTCVYTKTDKFDRPCENCEDVIPMNANYIYKAGIINKLIYYLKW